VPAPPSTSTATITSHCTAPTAASALVEMRPMNHMSVRLRTICTALFAISGNGERDHGTLIHVRATGGVEALRPATAVRGSRNPWQHPAQSVILAHWLR